MGRENFNGIRERDPADIWFYIIINTSVLALLINILSIYSGGYDVASHLLFIPIVIAAYWYPRRGLIFAIVLSVIYLGTVWFLQAGRPDLMGAAVVKSIVLVGVAAGVSSLSGHKQKSEVKYRGLFSYSAAGIGVVDRGTLAIKEANGRFAGMLGYRDGEMAAIQFRDLWISQAKNDEFFSILDNRGRVENLEAQFHSRGGAPRWVLVSSGKLPEGLFVCTIVDITGRKEAEEALLIKDYALHSSINAVAILNTDWTVRYVNDSFRKLMGYPPGHAFIGGHAGLWFTSDRTFGEISGAIRDEGRWTGEAVLRKFPRTQMYVLMGANRVNDAGGKTICIMVTFIDISEKKQIETVKREALEQIERNIEQFAILGDTIRNPLAVIVGLSSLVPGEASDRIIGQAREIDRIVAQLDRGWIESEKVQEFIRKYYQIGVAESTGHGEGTIKR